MKHPKVLIAMMMAFSMTAAGCVTNDNEAGTLPAITEIDVTTPGEAELLAAQEINKSNVDAAYETLLREVEGDQ